MKTRGRPTITPNQRNYGIILIILIILILIWFLWSKSNFEPPLSPICTPNAQPQNRTATNGFFLDSQVIVTGPKGSMDSLNALADGVVIEDCNLSFLSARSFNTTSAPLIDGKEQAEWKFAGSNLSDKDQRIDLVMRLYEFPSVKNIEDKIAEINASGNAKRVFADPNYLTSPTATPGVCGLPYSGGGGGGGTPYGGMTPLVASPNATANEQFTGQWALQKLPGANFPARGTSENNSNQPTGKGVRIGVFDTSPFSPTSRPSNISVPAQPTTLNLRVTNAITIPVRSTGSLDVSDHGLFVAGLIHEIAPDSEIHLIRVLNDEGCGTLFDITKAIEDFTYEMSSSKAEGKTLDNVVLNLSLGIHQPDQETMTSTANRVAWNKLLRELVSFETAVREAHDMGAIIIAAAGNDSSTSTAKPMELPANYDTTIGVAATNMDPHRSCYSNKGDVAAPGGDGGQVLPSTSSAATPQDPNCSPRATTWNRVPLPPQCSTMEQCRYGLISLSWRSTGGRQGYVYWAGTSFATPLVSGLAALALQDVQGNSKLAACLIQDGAEQHPIPPDVRWGLIDMNYSLTSSNCFLQ